MKKIYLFLLLGIFLFSLAPMVSAIDNIGTFEKDTTIQLIQVCDTCSYVNLYSVILPNGTIELYNTSMTKVDYNYYTDYNVTEIGSYRYTVCGDKDSDFKCELFEFEVTPSGESIDNIQLYSRIFLIVLLILLVIFIQRSSKRINYDSWYNQMAQKYEEKNWIKFGLSALAYNLMSNSWILSYLVGLLGLLILTDLVYLFNITSALQIMKIVFGLYTWSSIAVALIFFSQVQEWIVGWLKDLQNLNWGIDKQ